MFFQKMKLPDALTTVKDPSTHITWEIVAYRALTEQEAVQVIENYLRDTKPKKHPKNGSTVMIHSAIGCLPGL